MSNALKTSFKNLFRFCHFLVVIYSESPVPKIPEFNQALIPDGQESEKSKQELRKLVDELCEQKEQAKAEMHGQRPLIFYTNGFDTYLWDDQFYTERQVHGFYTKDELQLNIDRRSDRRDLREFKVNVDIAGRPYQLEAIKRVAENLVVTDATGGLRGKARQSLLVMATGSGKTRVSVAIVDLLTKCNWAIETPWLPKPRTLSMNISPISLL